MSQIMLTHALRHLPPWLILDVRQKMLSLITGIAVFALGFFGCYRGFKKDGKAVYRWTGIGLIVFSIWIVIPEIADIHMRMNHSSLRNKTIPPNQAPQTTICTVTDRAPSSTLRASADRV